MQWFILPLASLLAAFFAFGIQPPFRRGKSERHLITEWLASTSMPAMAVLPATGVIVEANRAATDLFQGHSLLESELGALFPAHRAALNEALSRVQSEGHASVDLGNRGKHHLTLVLTLPRPGSSPLVAMVITTPARPVEQPAAPPAPSFPPLALEETWFALPIEQQLQSLLQKGIDQWPIRSAAILQRRGMSLSPVIQAGQKLPAETFQLPTIELGYLLHDGRVVQHRSNGFSLLFHPLYLPTISKQPWGTIALARNGELGPDEQFQPALQQLATLSNLLLTAARRQNGQKHQARELKQMSAIQHHLLSQSRRGILLVNRTGRIEAINRVASDLLSWPVEDVTGRPLSSLLDDLGPLGNKIATALADPAASKKQSSIGRLQRPGKRGQELTFTVERVAGAPDYALLLLEDQEGAAAFTETQHHLDRLAVLGKMSAMIAHDLRNPLASILYGIETLGESLGEEHPEWENIKLLLDEGERVHRIIEDILSMSRQPSLTISLCSLRTLLDQVHDTHQRQLSEKGIHLRRYYDPSLPLIEGDPVRLGQMLGNLVNNAIEAVPGGGQIEIVLRPLALDQMIARGLNPDQEERLQGGVEILIRDNGPGIPEHQREQIFEPLFTTRSNGTGLGLPIVRTIVEQHRGMLFLDSEVGKGTTFQIFLPQLAISAGQR